MDGPFRVRTAELLERVSLAFGFLEGVAVVFNAVVAPPLVAARFRAVVLEGTLALVAGGLRGTKGMSV